MRALVPVLLALVVAASATAQPAEATAADGRAVLLYDDGVWVPADAVVSGLRDGHRLTSRTGAYEIYVPTGWTITKPKGSPIDGEFFLEHPSTGAAAFISFLSQEELGMGDVEFGPHAGAALFWAGMQPETVHAEREPTRLRVLDGHRVALLDGELRFPYEPTMAFQLTTHVDVRGMLVLMTMVEPVDLADARATIDTLHRSLAITPITVDAPAGSALQGRADDFDSPD